MAKPWGLDRSAALGALRPTQEGKAAAGSRQQGGKEAKRQGESSSSEQRGGRIGNASSARH
jgi:hypothetical protein